MEKIEQINNIDTNKLSKEFYFQSLLEEAYKQHMVSDTDIEKIQLGCLELLAQKTESYNGGDSSSIRVEIAESIMRSNIYTIGIALKTYAITDDAVKALQYTKIADLYKTGRKSIYLKIDAAKKLFTLALENKLNTENYTYNSTVVDGINGFFKIYNPDYEAQEIHITADYPLYNPTKNLAGIEFIEKYIESIYYENMFCKYFSEDDIHFMLCGYDKDYKDLIFNIFEQVLTCSLGRAIAGLNTASVFISDMVFEKLNNVFSEKSDEQIDQTLKQATRDLFEQLSISNESLNLYIQKGLPQIKSNICNAIKHNTLRSVFPTPKRPDSNPKTIVYFGEKMENEKYRKLVDEIMQCRYGTDKVSIIMHNIKSLGDLEDILIDAELNRDEMITIFKKLSSHELAALTKRHPKNPEFDFDDASKSEQTLRSSIYDFIQIQSEDYKNRFKAIMDCIEIK